MKKNILKLSVLFIFMLLVTGCGNQTVTYSVDTGDKIKVKLNKSGGYELSISHPFTVFKKDEKLSEGTFIHADYYQNYVDDMKVEESNKVIDEGSTKTIDYAFYSHKEDDITSYNYIIRIKDSNTGIIVENMHSEKEAKKVLKKLKFSVVKE